MVYGGPTKLSLSTNGVLSADANPDWPAENNVRLGIEFDNGQRVGTYYVAIPTPITATSINRLKQNLKVEQYANFVATVTANDTYNSPIDLTNYTVSGSLKENEDSSLKYDFDINKTDAENGQFTIGLTSDQTALLTKNSYQYDITIENIVTDNTIRILQGYVHISKGVTHT